MKTLLLLLALVLPTTAQSQRPDDVTYTIDASGISFVTITKSEFDRMLDNFRIMLDSEADKTQMLVLLNREVELLKFMIRNDSLKLDIKDAQLQSFEREVALYNEQLIKALRNPWYNRKELYYILGVITVLAAKG